MDVALKGQKDYTTEDVEMSASLSGYVATMNKFNAVSDMLSISAMTITDMH